MKFSKFLMLAGLTAFMASCSSDEPIIVDNNSDPIPPEVAGVESYALFTLSMPEQPGTRAAISENPNLKQEYAIANGRILLFKKVDDEPIDSATFVGRFSIATNFENDDAIDVNKTSYVAATFPAGTFDKDNSSYCALVVINAPSGFPYPKAPVDATETQPAKPGQSFGSWAKEPKEFTFLIKEGEQTYMTMISAPEYKTTSTSTTTVTSTLVDLPGAKIVTDVTKLDKNNPAATFFVHRIPAKVTLKAPGNKNEAADHIFKIESGYYKGAQVTFTGWDVDVVAKKCYPVQNVQGLNLFPKHMHTETGTGSPFPSFNRCSWAYSPYYYAKNEAPHLNQHFTAYATENYDRREPKTNATAWADDRVEYIKENTMEANAQVQKRTTRVVLSATYQIPDPDNSNNVLDATSLFRIGRRSIDVANVNPELFTWATLKALVEKKIPQVLQKECTVAQNSLSEAGYYSISDIFTIKNKDDNSALSTADYDTLAKELGLKNSTEKEIAYFLGGTCYYQVRIRHFDNNEASLGNTEINTAADYLPEHTGRYGILRNNWYDIEINSVSKIGEPTIPTPGDDPDDEPEKLQAIDFTINMLNWAKRNQTANL